MNDTTWFWQIVDARGLADVSSEETVALGEILDRSHRAEAKIETLREALKPFAKAAEDCGVEDDLRIGVVKPADIIWESAVAVSITYAHVDRARKVLENGKPVLADATNDPAESSLSSLRKGAEVAVKPLVWNEYETEGEVDRWDAETALGSFYEISTEFDGYSVSNDHVHSDQRFDTPDEAKAFAQSDYETRIRSALVSGSREDG